MNEINYPVFAKRIQQVMTENGWNSGERLKRLAAATGKPEHWFFLPIEEIDSSERSQRELDETELVMLSLFNQLPEAEKLRLILHTKGVLNDLELLKNDVYDLINNNHK